MDLALETPPETFEWLKGRGKRVLQLQSEEAKDEYNELAGKGERVAILLHSTC